MPSVTEVQQQQSLFASNIHGKSTPPPPSTTTASVDSSNTDSMTQAIHILEKKQRNLGKRKEKLESYQKEAKDGKELNKDQRDALAKYPEVLGQIECVKELSEQFKKIQTEGAKNQKRLLKQAAEEKRLLMSERLREYAQLRYLLDHRPTTLKSDESSLLDELSATVIPTDNSSDSISRSVDTFLSIYHSTSLPTKKTLAGKTLQEAREILEQLMQNFDVPRSSPLSSVPHQEIEEQIQEVNESSDIQVLNRNLNECPLQFDTRNQNIPLEQIIHNSPFFPIDLNSQQTQDTNLDQSPDPKQYLQTFTVINSNINEQLSSNQQQNDAVNVVASTDEQQQQLDEPWQLQRGNGNAHKIGQYHDGGGNRNYNRGGSNNFNQQQRRGTRGTRYDQSYGSSQRPYNENSRPKSGSGQHYRGHRGGAYRPSHRGYHNNDNEYQKSTPYQQNNDRRQQVRSAPASQQH